MLPIRRFWPALLLTFTGCPSTHYEIEMTPLDGGFERKLTAWHDTRRKDAPDKSLSEAEADRIQKVYGGGAAPPADGRHRFAGNFTTRTPADVGGFGFFKRYESPLGSVTLYAERFLGSDDLTGTIDARKAAANEVVDLLAGWCAAEMGDDPLAPKMKAWLEGELRRDLMNMVLLAWALELLPPNLENIQKEFSARAGLYAVEHGYASPEDWPQWQRAYFDLNQHDRRGPMCELVRRVVAGKLGLAADAPLPNALDFLGPDRVEASLKKYLAATPAYEALKNNSIDPLHVIQRPLVLAFLPAFPANGVSVDVSQVLPRQPFLHNGTWDESESRLDWSCSTSAAEGGPPVITRVLFTAWAEPNANAQEQHFGKVLLDGQDLANYCLWHGGLNGDEQKQWNKFLDQLEPGPGLRKRLGNFRFPGERPPAQEGQSTPNERAHGIIEMLQSKLGE